MPIKSYPKKLNFVKNVADSIAFIAVFANQMLLKAFSR